MRACLVYLVVGIQFDYLQLQGKGPNTSLGRKRLLMFSAGIGPTSQRHTE